MVILNRLTQLIVNQTTQPGRYTDGANLYLNIGRTGCKSWVFRYLPRVHVSGGERWIGLGPTHTVSLSEARAKARALRNMILDGKDPYTEMDRARGEQRSEITFATATDMFLRTREGDWKNDKHRKQWRSTLEQYAFPVVGAMAVGDVEPRHVLAILNPIIKKGRRETADRVLGRIKNVLGYAISHQLREGPNPAAEDIKSALPKRPKGKHHAALPFAELPALMAKLSAKDCLSARALQFLILTAARTSEVIGARWEEIDLAARTWTVPAERMKAGKAHVVPLSDAAMDILKSLAESQRSRTLGELIFPLSNMAMAELIKGLGAPTTVHGLRSTFSDWVGERTAYSQEVREMALAHTIKNKAEAAYRRGTAFDKRARLMADWARFCFAPLAEGKVVSLRA